MGCGVHQAPHPTVTHRTSHRTLDRWHTAPTDPRHPKEPDVTRTRPAVRTVLGLLTLALLTGCATETTSSSAAEPEPVTTPAPTATPRPVAPEIPVQRADLDSLEAARPTPPTRLQIDALGIELPIDPVGVADDGQMEIPPLAERGGWYRHGAAPGTPSGTAVIAAHVDSIASAGLGPFARLIELEIGDVVQVTLDDGTVHDYAVTDVVALAKPEVTWDDVFVRDGGHRLVLVTCGGTFQRSEGHYSDNVIVTAEPVGA